MSRASIRRAAAAALAVTLLALGTPAAAVADRIATQGGAVDQDRPELQESLQEIVGSGITGVQLRVHDRRGDWAGSAGVRKLGASAEPPTNGRFRIGSNTKTFTATLVLQLVAEGKVGLDTPAADHLPQFELDRSITVRMLLQHTSGLFNHTGEAYTGTWVPGIPMQGEEWVANRFHTYRPAELVQLSLSHPLNFEPGTSWSYSNTNYLLLGLLIEEVTGRTFAEAMQQRILQPLRLRDTVVPGGSPRVPGPHAHSYYRYEHAGEERTIDITRQNVSWALASGDMMSTTRDLDTFFAALMSGELLPGPLLAEMRTPHPDSPGYGLGLFVQDRTTPSPFPTPSCDVTLYTHNGGVMGSGALMYSTADASTTLSASLTYVDDPEMSNQALLWTWMSSVIDEVFCRQGATAGGAEPGPAGQAWRPAPHTR